MPKFFVNNVNSDTIEICGKDALHIKTSLRMGLGDDIILTDENSYDYNCIITDIGDSILCKIVSVCKNIAEPNIKIYLYMSLPKSDKFEFIIQKCVELGVYKIIPVLSTRCVSRPENFKKKLDRYNKISVEAAKQSKRGIVPTVCDLMDYNSALVHGLSSDISIICYENEKNSIKSYLTHNAIGAGSASIFVGPEGGFDDREIFDAVNHKYTIVSLGKRILRCETAPIVAISSILYATDNL